MHILHFVHNLGQNICRLFHVLAQFLFTTSKTKPDFYQQKVNARIASRVSERSIFGIFPRHFRHWGAKVSTQEKKRLRIFHGIFAAGGLCPHKKKKTSDIRKLGNFKKIPEMFRFDGEYPASYPRSKFWHCEESFVKHSTEKPILFNFVNLSTTFSPRMHNLG